MSVRAALVSSGAGRVGRNRPIEIASADFEDAGVKRPDQEFPQNFSAFPAKGQLHL